MRSWLPVAVLSLVFAGPARGTTPTYAKNGTGNSGTLSSNAVSSYKMTLPNRTGAGNAVLCGYNYGAGRGVTAAVSDDRGNSYANFSSSDGGQVVNIARALNVAAGASVVTVAFSGGNPTSVSGGCFEYYNVAGSGADDGMCSGSGTGTTVGCTTAIVTSGADDLIFQYAIEDGTQNPINGWTPGASPWTPLILDAYSDQAFQYEVQGTAGPVTPSLKLAPSQTWNTIAIALKAGSGGTAPAGRDPHQYGISWTDHVDDGESVSRAVSDDRESDRGGVDWRTDGGHHGDYGHERESVHGAGGDGE